MTPAEIQRRALEEINVVASGETPNGNDATTSAEKYNSLYERLQHEGLVTWGASDNIPTWAEQLLIVLLGFDMRITFSLPPNRIADLERSATAAMATLRKQLENDEQTSGVRACFF